LHINPENKETIMVTDTIERELSIAAPVERVWAALTEEKHVKEWFGDSAAEIDLRPGGAIVFGWSAHGQFKGQVEQVEAPRLFSYRWARSHDVDPAPGNSTLVEFTLTAEGSGTLLRIVESGFTSLDATPEEQAGHVKGNTEGWQSELDELRDYVERTA
jgi:uncharacterized protein YndB with AHSA1/START domain